MKTTIRILAFLCALAFLVHIPSISFSQIANHVVISEVYGGGGNGGSYWTHDFVELYNPTGSAIVMTNWSLQYQSSGGTGSFTLINTFSGTIPSHGFFLVQLAQGAGGTTPLPTPDATGGASPLALSATAGKVALVSDGIGITLPTDPTVVDFVGYGAAANKFEGAGPTGTLSNTSSAERKAQPTSTAASMSDGGADSLAGNGWDSNNNSADFVIKLNYPYPQNSTWTLETPPVIGNIPPAISAVSRSVFVPATGGTDSVYANIQDLDGTIAAAKLHVRVNGGAYDSSLTMAVVSGNLYGGLIPATKHTANGNLVEYHISATDNGSGYSSTVSTLQGYFVGDAPISSIKAFTVTSVNGYAARVNGTLNVNTNLYTNGQGFIQDATAGLQIFRAGGLPSLNEGRNAKVQGTIIPFAGAFEMSDPGLAFVDTALGTSVLTPVTITLPTNQSHQYVNEGRLVRIVGMSTDSTGTFSASRSYNYYEGDSDTITVRIESNGSANNLVGRNIPALPVDVLGVLSFQNINQRVKPRRDTDMGIPAGDGTGTATMTPSFRFSGVSAVAETLTITGDGVSTLQGISVTIPSTWTWDGTSHTLAGAGFGSASSVVSGAGTVGDPWVITVSSAAVTNTNTGSIRISNLTTPGSIGLTTWTTRTRIAAGSLANIVVQPTVNIVSGFEVVVSGNWNSPSTWSNGVVPGPGDNVTLTTLGTTLTIDVANAQCNNLTLTGTGSASNSGPVLQFASSGPSQLTVNGHISISGGSGGGSGNRGGRPQLTSNGNGSAVLIAKRNITTSSSNSTTNGNAGLNMNEGTVKLTGATSDTIHVGAGFRLGNLEIGDGSVAKTMSTEMNSTAATMTIRSLVVRQNSTFWIGTSENTNLLNIGSVGVSGVPTLSGGITVETGATLKAIFSNAGEYVATINLFGGGITNNGTLNMLSFTAASPFTHCYYKVNIDSTNQTISGSTAGLFSDMTIGAGSTLTLQQDVNVADGFTMTLNGTLAENPGRTVVGAIEATRTVAAATLESFGGIGLELNATASAPGPTAVRRVTGVPSVGGSNTSILRYFDVTPDTNTGLNATLRYFYDNTELDGQNPVTLQLWKSENSGSTWTAQGGTVDTGLHRIEVTGLDGLSRWTASDAAHPLSGGGTVTLGVPVALNWNIVSLPVTSPVPGDSVKQLFTNSINPYAFAFTGSYQQRFIMINAPGYWIKSSAAYTQDIVGTPLDNLTVPVNNGWNMIGSISTAIDTSAAFVTPSVPGLRGSNYFRYSAGYVVTGTITPGLGFWVKANGAGSFLMHSTSASKSLASQSSGRTHEDLNSITIQDANGGTQTLYFGADSKGEVPVAMFAMPPSPPVGAFDARFASADGGTMVQTHTEEVSEVLDLPISIQSMAYPLTISWNVGDGAYELHDGATSHPMRGEGTVKITNSSIEQIVLKVTDGSGLPKEFALSQNYPNPFNPTTSVKYALPVDSRVTMEIYNVIGQRVRTLVNDNLEAGYHAAEWNGKNNAGQQLSSGMYFLQLSARGTNGKSFNEVRKLMLLK